MEYTYTPTERRYKKLYEGGKITKEQLLVAVEVLGLVSEVAYSLITAPK